MIFGIVIFVFIFDLFKDKGNWGVVLVIINTFLYPYSRFVYESIVNFIMGDNVFFFNGIVFLVAKCITMIFCYLFATTIAPIGLIYLYFYHSRRQD